MLKGNNERLKNDLSMLAVGLFFAVLLWQSNSIDTLLASLSKMRLFSAFAAGLFFTSSFTTMPAMAFIAKLAHFNSPLTIAFLGALGAVIGDAAIFYFLRDRLINDFLETLKKSRLRRIRHFLKSKIIRLSLGVASGVLVALPLPTDETAYSLLGLSRPKTYTFLFIAFTANFISIYLITSAVVYFTS